MGWGAVVPSSGTDRSITDSRVTSTSSASDPSQAPGSKTGRGTGSAADVGSSTGCVGGVEVVALCRRRLALRRRRHRRSVHPWLSLRVASPSSPVEAQHLDHGGTREPLKLGIRSADGVRAGLPARVEELRRLEELAHRRRLTARQDQAVRRRRARPGLGPRPAVAPPSVDGLGVARRSPCSGAPHPAATGEARAAAARPPSVPAARPSPAALGEPVRLRDRRRR